MNPTKARQLVLINNNPLCGVLSHPFYSLYFQVPGDVSHLFTSNELTQIINFDHDY